MQIFASDKNSQRIFVERAAKAEDYFCIECGEIVRVRGGPQKQLHFYHLLPKGSCRQHGKTVEHLLIQNLICNQCEGAEQEVRFSEINRIADVACGKRKLIFEVQCSPITYELVQARNFDYGSIGWKVIWILFDKTFNKRRASSAEDFLIQTMHYFSNAISIYDEPSFIHKGMRHHLLIDGRRKKFPVHLGSIRDVQEGLSQNCLPRFLKQRVEHWSHAAKDDLLDQTSKELFQELLRQEEALLPDQQAKSFLQIIKKGFWRVLSALHAYCLEKSSS